VNKTDWKRHANPAVVNAFYSSLENSIQFPAGILQVRRVLNVAKAVVLKKPARMGSEPRTI
jgi:hypothetical protein